MINATMEVDIEDTFDQVLNSTPDIFYIDGSSTAGQTYRYVVTAINAVGESEQSNIVEGGSITVPTPPNNIILNAKDHLL